MDLVSLENTSLGATRPSPETAEAGGKRPKLETKAPWEYKRKEDLEESDFSMYDDYNLAYMFSCERFVYKNKAMIEQEKAYAEYKERSRNLTPYDAIAPPRGLCGSISPFRITDDFRPRFIRLCDLALKRYNADNQGANFVFHDLVKATAQPVSGYMFFITFQARDATHTSSSTIETFQAQVWERLDLEPVVKSCSIKPT